MRKRSKKKNATSYNYQVRAKEFKVGDTVQLIMGSATDVGRVTEVYPAIGMVQVQWPSTSYQHPVEDLIIVNPGDSMFIAPLHESVPAGLGTVPVSDGPPAQRAIPNVEGLVEDVRVVRKASKETINKIAKAFVKKSLYWNGINRQYRCTQTELDSHEYLCPRCDGNALRGAVYKREDGKSVRLLACDQCLFLIRRRDIVGDPTHEEE